MSWDDDGWDREDEAGDQSGNDDTGWGSGGSTGNDRTGEPSAGPGTGRDKSRARTGDQAQSRPDGAAPHRGPEGQQDPIRKNLGGQEDLYDVATWENRGPLDGLAVQITQVLRLTRTWLLIGLAALVFLAQAGVVVLLVTREPTLGVLSVLSLVPALLLAGYFWFEDPTRREPVFVMAITFLLSVLLASIAAIVNSTFAPAFRALPLVGLPLFFFLVVAPIEETVKWASIRFYAYRDERFDAVIDGVVYGAIAGLGFAAIENFTYIVDIYFRAAQLSGIQPLDAAEQTAYVRALVGPGHVIYSAFAGYYLGLAKFNPEHRGEIVVKGLLIAVFIHGTYNTLVSSLPLTNVTLVAFIVVFDGFWFLFLYRKVARYKSYYRKAKDAEVASQRAYQDEAW